MESIYLVGFMGAGKTTVSKLLAQELGLQLIDTDHVIETKLDRSVSQIFEEYGENYFRQLEHVVLKGVIKDNRIITTGGGVVLRADNRDFLQNRQNVIYLKASAKTIFDRLKDDTTRPLLQTENKLEAIESLLEQRNSLYEEVATYTVDTDGLSLEEVVQEIAHNIK